MPTPSWTDGLSLRHPSDPYLEAYVETLSLRRLSYATPGMTLRSDTPPGYRLIELTTPVSDWSRAVDAVRRWEMHSQRWAQVRPIGAPIEPGRDVATLAKAAGLSWLVPARVVAVVDESDRFGFAYGTLEGHIVTGEELFIVERTDRGSRCHITVISKPADWAAAIGAPLIRRFQRKFVRGALQAVRRASD